MAEHVCPWWIGYLLAAPLRRLWQDPHIILSPYVRDGMTILEPGPGMGFFTLELARLVGARGRVIALDVQEKMLRSLERRARKAGLEDRIILRQANGASMGINDLAGQVDFALAFAVIHELPDPALFFREATSALKPGGKLLLAEPMGHVNTEAWARTLQFAYDAGLNEETALVISRSHAVLLSKV
jgi:ubiquinone/menaquinone biosynthesis C-methylase UbiE